MAAPDRATVNFISEALDQTGSLATSAEVMLQKHLHDYDQASAGLIERHEIGTTSGLVIAKWITCFDGVSRCNDVLKAIKKTTSAPQNSWRGERLKRGSFVDIIILN